VARRRFVVRFAARFVVRRFAVFRVVAAFFEALRFFAMLSSSSG
jgi:hypothetical protein